MTFNEYQAAAKHTAIARGTDLEVYERVLGLVGETGEIAEKFKKNIRDQGADLSKLDKADMAKELGDVLWYLAVLADHLDIPLQDIADKNIAKLASRQQRGTLSGSGDNR